MKAKELIKTLQENPEGEVFVKVATLQDREGFKTVGYEWVPMEPKHVKSTLNGMNPNIFIGQIG